MDPVGCSQPPWVESGRKVTEPPANGTPASKT
jgi:hypothetical protein